MFNKNLLWGKTTKKAFSFFHYHARKTILKKRSCLGTETLMLLKTNRGGPFERPLETLFGDVYIINFFKAL